MLKRLLILVFLSWAAIASGAPEAIRIPTRDGKELAADVYPCAAGGKRPVILIMTPYNRLHFREQFQPGQDPLYDPDRYTYVTVDWRGFYGSKDAVAQATGLPQNQLGQDGFDCVEWIAAQPWCNGKIGTWGPSALGRVQFHTAAQNPPHLVCIVPVVAKFGHSYGQYYHGGVLKTGYLDGLTKAGFSPSLQVIYDHPREDVFWRLIGHTSNPTNIRIPVFMVGGWYDLFTDGVLETFTTLHNRSKTIPGAPCVKILIGPWHHTAMGHLKQTELAFPKAEGVSIKEAKRFLDRWLLDEGTEGDEGSEGSKEDNSINAWDSEADIRYFQMGENQWVDASAWPPMETTPARWHLQPEGGLGLEKPTRATSDGYTYNPLDPSPTIGGMNLSFFELSKATPQIKFLLKRMLRAGPMDQRLRVEARNDNLIYTTAPLDQDIRVIGNPRLRLYVSTDCPDTDVAVRLCEVYPDGRSMLIGDGIQRLKFRKETTSPAKPGEVYAVDIALPVTAVTFKKAHRIRIIITSSNYPRFDCNPNNGQDRIGDNKDHKVRTAANRVYHGGEHPSALILPVASKPAGQ